MKLIENAGCAVSLHWGTVMKVMQRIYLFFSGWGYLRRCSDQTD